MHFNRRRFLAQSASLIVPSVLRCTALPTAAADSQPAAGRTGSESPKPKQIVTIEAADGDELQRVLFQHAGKNRHLRLARPVTLTCMVRDEVVEGERSIHPLLVPSGVNLDLNDSTLLLDLRSNSYGVRLSNHSSIANGTIKIVRSEGKGSQAIWHSGISIGAAYGDGGTPEKPGRFATVSHWSIENITIDQPFAASAIQLMSEACHGVIRNVRVLDSDKALLGIGLDWGTVGPLATADELIPQMGELWKQGKIYGTHPHDILIERIRVGKLTRNVDGNDAGVRCSACHRITIRDLEVEEAATAVAIFGGDCGYEYARADQRESAHKGYVLENIKIAKALRFGIVLNGVADNVWRASRSHGYVTVRDPVHPGLDRPIVRNASLHGAGRPNAQGIYAVALTDATLDDLNISDFSIGVHVEDWVRGMRFRGTKFANNTRDTQIEGTREKATGVVFDPPPKS